MHCFRDAESTACTVSQESSAHRMTVSTSVSLRTAHPTRAAYAAARSLVTWAIVGVAALPPVAGAQQALTADESLNIAKDTARHFGDAPTDPGLRAQELSRRLAPVAVDAAMRKVADWELARAQPDFERVWTWSVLYTGFLAAADTLHEPRYTAAMVQMGDKFHWQLASALPNADAQSVAQTYLELYLQKRDPARLQPTQAALDALLAAPLQASPAGQAAIPWWWCDALFMAPPVWARLYAATQQPQYLQYLETQWWQTSKLLYSPQYHLYYRDQTFLHQAGPDGKPIFWSRGNGWVMGGIVRTLEYLPPRDPARKLLVQQLQQMAAAVTPLQDPATGLWHASLLDSADYPLPETSGSALIIYALAWGVNHHQLARRTYLPVIAKAWSGLVGQVYADGRLGGIQQTGAAPAHYLPSSSYNYGVGAFLLAGSQVAQLPANTYAARVTH